MATVWEMHLQFKMQQYFFSEKHNFPTETVIFQLLQKNIFEHLLLLKIIGITSLSNFTNNDSFISVKKVTLS